MDKINRILRRQSSCLIFKFILFVYLFILHEDFIKLIIAIEIYNNIVSTWNKINKKKEF